MLNVDLRVSFTYVKDSSNGREYSLRYKKDIEPGDMFGLLVNVGKQVKCISLDYDYGSEDGYPFGYEVCDIANINGVNEIIPMIFKKIDDNHIVELFTKKTYLFGTIDDVYTLIDKYDSCTEEFEKKYDSISDSPLVLLKENNINYEIDDEFKLLYGNFVLESDNSFLPMECYSGAKFTFDNSANKAINYCYEMATTDDFIYNLNHKSM